MKNIYFMSDDMSDDDDDDGNMNYSYVREENEISRVGGHNSLKPGQVKMIGNDRPTKCFSSS